MGSVHFEARRAAATAPDARDEWRLTRRVSKWRALAGTLTDAATRQVRAQRRRATPRAKAVMAVALVGGRRVASRRW